MRSEKLGSGLEEMVWSRGAGTGGLGPGLQQWGLGEEESVGLQRGLGSGEEVACSGWVWFDGDGAGLGSWGENGEELG